MNFFKRFGRKTTVSILDHTYADENVGSEKKIRRSSAGLRRSGGLSHHQDSYHENETKLFTEPLYPEIVSPDLKINGTKETGLQYDTRQHKNMGIQPEVIVSESSTAEPSAAAESLAPGSDGEEDVFNNDNFKTEGSLQVPSILKDTQSSEKSLEDGTKSESMLNESNVQHMMGLYAAIIKGDRSEVKKILTAHPSLLEAQDNFGRTPLMYCVLSDRVECAKLLLKMRCKLDQVDKAGRSALHLAAHKASYKILELLCERGGSIYLKDKDGQTPLHLTTRNRHPRCLEFLLRRFSPGFVDAPDNKNRSALHWSAAFNNVECIRLLLKHNSNVALVDGEGKTPLHWAANNHDPNAVACIKALLDYSPNVLNWQDYEGRTAIHYAVAVENGEVVSYLLSFKKICVVVDRPDNTFRTPLHWAAQLGNAIIVKQLLDFGAKIFISDLNGATPFLYAALNNNPAVVLEMISHDPQVVGHTDIEGRNALMWACGKGANDVIQALLELKNEGQEGEEGEEENGEATTKDADTKERSPQQSIKLKKSHVVDVNCTDNKGNTALHVASWNGSARSAELLLSYKARHDLQNNMNHTPLFGACEKGHLNVVKHLLDYNASIFLTDLEKRSPLHWAALGGHADVCDFLIQKGLHQDKQDSYLRSPLHCSAFGGFINCMNLLLEHGASVDLQDKEGLSALHWAAQSGHLDATKLLIQYNAFPNLMEFTEERLTPLDHALIIGRDDVAQYLMEQGALSSETIRDIAAARIQAYYRGYKVRKDFLRRKNLLMEHEMKLRNRKDRNKYRRAKPDNEAATSTTPPVAVAATNMQSDNMQVLPIGEALLILEESSMISTTDPTKLDEVEIEDRFALQQDYEVTTEGDDITNNTEDVTTGVDILSEESEESSRARDYFIADESSYSTVARPPPEGASSQCKDKVKKKRKPALKLAPMASEEEGEVPDATDADVGSSVFVSEATNSTASSSVIMSAKIPESSPLKHNSEDFTADDGDRSVGSSRENLKKTPEKVQRKGSGRSNCISTYKSLFDGDMLMSEYIEGMLPLSSTERKVVKQLQRNRKRALLKAANAAEVIQRWWRRVLEKRRRAERKRLRSRGANQIESLAVTFDNLPTTASTTGTSSPFDNQPQAEGSNKNIVYDYSSFASTAPHPPPPPVVKRLQTPGPSPTKVSFYDERPPREIGTNTTPQPVEKQEKATGTSTDDVLVEKVRMKNKRVGTNTKVVDVVPSKKDVKGSKSRRKPKMYDSPRRNDERMFEPTKTSSHRHNNHNKVKPQATSSHDVTNHHSRANPRGYHHRRDDVTKLTRSISPTYQQQPHHRPETVPIKPNHVEGRRPVAKLPASSRFDFAKRMKQQQRPPAEKRTSCYDDQPGSPRGEGVGVPVVGRSDKMANRRRSNKLNNQDKLQESPRGRENDRRVKQVGGNQHGFFPQSTPPPLTAGHKPRIVETYRPTMMTSSSHHIKHRSIADGKVDDHVTADDNGKIIDDDDDDDDGGSSLSSRGPVRVKCGGDERVGTARSKKLRPTTVAASASSRRLYPGSPARNSSNLPNQTFLTSETQLQKIYGQLQKSYLYQPKKGVASSTTYSYNMDDGNF